MNKKQNISLTRAAKQSELIVKINEILKSYGYSEIFLPLYEDYDVLKETVYDFRDDNIVRFIDRNTGKSLVLRPDFTPQVCRTVANYMSESPLPLRLSYKGRVFRNVNTNKGIKSEKYQMGGELFGASELYGDFETLLIASAVMKKLKFTNHKIIIGDANLLKKVLNIVNNNEDYELCLTGKQFSMLNNCLSGLPVDENEFNLLKYFPYACGSLDILNKLKGLCSFNSELVERVDYIINLFKKLIDMGIPENVLVFDAGETRGLNYYTGINFNIIYSDRGISVGGGGRYDTLMNHFGMSLTSCGVAFDIEELLSFYDLNESNTDFDYLFIGKKMFFEAEDLRKKGYSVFWVEKEENLEELKTLYKFKNICSEVQK